MTTGGKPETFSLGTSLGFQHTILAFRTHFSTRRTTSWVLPLQDCYAIHKVRLSLTELLNHSVYGRFAQCLHQATTPIVDLPAANRWRSPRTVTKHRQWPQFKPLEECTKPNQQELIQRS